MLLRFAAFSCVPRNLKAHVRLRSNTYSLHVLVFQIVTTRMLFSPRQIVDFAFFVFCDSRGPTPPSVAISCGCFCFWNLNESRSPSFRNTTVAFFVVGWTVSVHQLICGPIGSVTQQIYIEILRFCNWNASCLVAFRCGFLRARKLETRARLRSIIRFTTSGFSNCYNS